MRRLCLALLLLPTACKPKPPPPDPGYIDTLYSLRQILNESELIGEWKVEGLDAEVVTFRITRSHKGVCKASRFSLKVPPKTGFKPWESEETRRQLVPGSTVVAFSAGGAMVLYVHRFFVVAYGNWGDGSKDGEWCFVHLENTQNRAYHGSAVELASLLPGLLEGRVQAPPPDRNRPPIDQASLRDLPLPGRPVDEEYLSPPFRRSRPPSPELRVPENPREAVEGLRYEVLRTLDDPQPLATGSAPLPEVDLPTSSPLRFRGFLEAPEDGDYFFFLQSASRADLSFGDDLLLSHEGGAALLERGADLALRAGRHAITIRVQPAAGDPPLRLLWSGPGFTKRPVPAASFRRAY